ncbi:MAG TPA: thioredoxin domain-containing protein [Gemmatimonadales bacterium]|nr:thioredoxin domain-containing protein [Gemmatimonadales bacterium]
MSTLDGEVGERDHVLGGADARVTLVEYGDFECPDCGRAYPVLKAVQKALGPNLRFVFRHFPLPASHPHAAAAAEAAEAAAGQERFWEMHDRLFEHQTALDESDLRKHARKIGLDLERFENDMRLHTHERRVREDLASGSTSGVHGTPTLFINGQRYDGPRERSALVAALARAALTLPVA